MADSGIFLYIIAEVAVLLVVICVFLLVHIGKLKKLVTKLEEKVVALRDAVSKSRRETRDALKRLADQKKIKPKTYLYFLDEEIEGTREHHQSLNPDRDIVLDITPDTPMERQVPSLRHAFLIAEKEARYAGDEQHSSWDVLQSKLQQIIEFYTSLAPEEASDTTAADSESPKQAADDGRDEEIANYQKRIENLERFKKLFFDMESQWEEAKDQAEDYHRQLMALGKDLGAGEDFEALMDKYAHSFDAIEAMVQEGAGEGGSEQKAPVVEIDAREESVGQRVIANQEEMQRLRNMAVDQHKLITELKKKLVGAKSAEDQQQVIEELSEQLEKQQRFLQEAETCTELIESELSRARQENESLRQQLEEGGSEQDNSEEIQRLEGVIGDLTAESKEMLGTIGALEQDNQRLKEQLAAAGGDDSEQVELLQGKLEEMQQELLNLQTQHIELEERYLELKTQ